MPGYGRQGQRCPLRNALHAPCRCHGMGLLEQHHRGRLADARRRHRIHLAVLLDDDSPHPCSLEPPPRFSIFLHIICCSIPYFIIPYHLSHVLFVAALCNNVSCTCYASNTSFMDGAETVATKKRRALARPFSLHRLVLML